MQLPPAPIPFGQVNTKSLPEFPVYPYVSNITPMESSGEIQGIGKYKVLVSGSPDGDVFSAVYSFPGNHGLTCQIIRGERGDYADFFGPEKRRDTRLLNVLSRDQKDELLQDTLFLRKVHAGPHLLKIQDKSHPSGAQRKYEYHPGKLAEDAREQVKQSGLWGG